MGSTTPGTYTTTGQRKRGGASLFDGPCPVGPCVDDFAGYR